jgi:hypothetical protein
VFPVRYELNIYILDLLVFNLRFVVHRMTLYRDFIMNWKDSEGRGCGLSEVLYQHFPGGTQENHENLKITAVPAEIRTTQLPNTNPYSFVK